VTEACGAATWTSVDACNAVLAADSPVAEASRGTGARASRLRNRNAPASRSWRGWRLAACWSPDCSSRTPRGPPERLPQRHRRPRRSHRQTAAEPSAAAHRDVLDQYCVICHNARVVRGESGGASPLAAQLRAAGLTLDTLDLDAVGERAEVWERVVRKLRAGMMPPAGRPRPESGVLDDLAAWLEGRLDAAARRRSDPGRPAAVHRLNRAEYRNAVRDLLAVEVAVEDLLPADDSSHGFDNVGVALRLSESLLERYLAAARRVSRLADLPVALVGGGAGRLAGNRHLRYPLHTPFMNLGLALLEKLDVRVDRIADSTGRLAGV